MKGHARSESATASPGRPFRNLSITTSSPTLSSTWTSTAESKSLHSSLVSPTIQQQQPQSPTTRAPNYKRMNSSGGSVPPLLYGPGAITITRSTTSLPPPPQKEAPRGIARATRRNFAAPSSPMTTTSSPMPLPLLASKNQQLKANIQRLRAARLPGTDPSHVDASFDEYEGLRGECMELARALAGNTAAASSRHVLARSQAFGGGGGGGGDVWYGTSVGETVQRLEKLRLGGSNSSSNPVGGGGGGGGGDVDALRASFGGLDISDSSSAPAPLSHPSHPPASAVTADHQGQQRQLRDVIANKAYLATLRDWRDLVAKLVTAHRTSLLETYQAHERHPLSADAVTRFLRNTHFRAEAIHKMRNATAWTSFKGFGTAPAYWPKYERRCRNFDALRRDLEEIDRELLGGSGERPPEAMAGGEGGKQVDESRPVYEWHTVAPRGDTILEFANDHPVVTNEREEAGKKSPVLRFRVSSHMLAETSSYFARLFSQVGDRDWNMDEPASRPQYQQQQLPSPRKVVVPSSSGSASETLKLYTIPTAATSAGTLEPNRHDALSILLHAAHMQTDKVPRTVTFAQFVAIAQVCLQYECTSPLEVFVEHLWLPAWVHMAAETAHNDQEQQDQSGGGGGGLLLISYVFGLRRLFTRMSKTAILHVVDEEDLWARPWPRKLKERIWAVRNAKLAQVHNACASAVQEYFQPPRRLSPQNADDSLTTVAVRNGAAIYPQHTHSTIKRPSSLLRASATATTTARHTMTAPPPHNDQLPAPSSVSLFSLSSTPRCPKGSHACDAANLGWLLLVFNELYLLQGGHNIVNLTSPLLPQPHPQDGYSTNTPPPSRSLAQLLNDLRSIPPSPSVHAHAHASPDAAAGVCDPATALRATVNDIYNSLSGLTLFEVDGKRHGWALSKGKVGEPQTQLTSAVPLGMLGRKEEEDVQQSHYHSRTMSAPCSTPAASTEATDGSMTLAGEAERDMGISEEEEDSCTYSSTLPPPSTTTNSHPNDHHRHQPPSLSPPSFNNEAICLRILSHLDTSDDLYSAALTNRAFYHALKNNELALMRHLVRAHRRLTLHVLEDSGGWPSSSLSPSASATLMTEEEGEGEKTRNVNNEKTLREWGETTTLTSPSQVCADIGWEKNEEEEEEEEEELQNGSIPETGAIAEAATYTATIPPSKTLADSFPPWAPHTMTEEEAHRIIWPDQPPQATTTTLSPTNMENQDAISNKPNKINGVTNHANMQNDEWTRLVATTEYSHTTNSNGSGHDDGDGTSAKFLLDNNVLRLVEDKTLVVLGDKTLREQLDQRIGIGDAS